MSESLLLVPVRTNRQGTSLNAGKLKKEYIDETATVELHSDDMARLGLRRVRLCFCGSSRGTSTSASRITVQLICFVVGELV